MSLISSYWEGFIKNLGESKDNNPVLYPLLKQAKLVHSDDEKITLSVSSPGAQEFLQKRSSEIEASFFDYSQKKVQIEFTIKIPIKKTVTAPLLSFEPSVEDISAKAGLNRKYNFDNFAVSNTNQVAYAAAQAVVKNPGSAYNPLFLYGGVGVGKTHLAQSVAKKILESDHNKKVYFCPGDNFTN